ncbi:hypothetical protein ACQ4PT_027162 [Festuca glaucescens]
MAAEAALEGSQPVDLSQHPSGIVPTLQNIVSTVNLDCQLDLKLIALQARNAEYNPKRFAAVIMRIREPKTTALVFASGKMVCTGAKSEQQSKLAARKYARIIQKLNFPAKFKDFEIQNIVASCDVKFPIRLEGLAYSHGAFASYEPELFPGLIYRMRQPKIVLLIFVSGKIVLTGAKKCIAYAIHSKEPPKRFPRVPEWRLAARGDSRSPRPNVDLIPPIPLLPMSLSLGMTSSGSGAGRGRDTGKQNAMADGGVADKFKKLVLTEKEKKVLDIDDTVLTMRERQRLLWWGRFWRLQNFTSAPSTVL